MRNKGTFCRFFSLQNGIRFIGFVQIIQTISVVLQAFYLNKYFALNPVTLLPLITLSSVISVVFILGMIYDTYDWYLIVFKCFSIGQCIIAKLILLAWIPVDAELMCTINEIRMGYILDSEQCLINPDLMT